MTVQNEMENQTELKRAPIIMRILAFWIDHMLMSFIFVGPYVIMIPPGELPLTPLALMLGAFVADCLKDCVQGASVGKRILGMGVRDTRQPSELPPIYKSIVRNIFSGLWPIEFLVLICSPSKTKIGDKLTRTNVYFIEKQAAKPRIVGGVISVMISVVISFVTLVFFVW